MANELVQVALTQRHDYELQIQFAPGMPELVADEPPPLGGGLGPSPVQLLAAAVGSCLTDSLYFALRKYKQSPEPIACTVQAEVGRNPSGRMRVLHIDAHLQLGVAAGNLEHLDRVLSQFEEFCTVTQSVALGIPVSVQVKDATGAILS